jgi:hypothetical protein
LFGLQIFKCCLSLWITLSGYVVEQFILKLPSPGQVMLCDQPNLQLNTDPHVKIFCSVNTSTQLIGLWEMNIIIRELLKKFGKVPSSVLLHPLTLKWVVPVESAAPWPEVLMAPHMLFGFTTRLFCNCKHTQCSVYAIRPYLYSRFINKSTWAITSAWCNSVPYLWSCRLLPSVSVFILCLLSKVRSVHCLFSTSCFLS